MGWVNDVSLLDGWLPSMMTWGAAIGAAVLLGTQSRRYLVMVLPFCIVGAAASAAVAYFVVQNSLGESADAVGATVYVWFGVAVLALLAVVPRVLVSLTTRERAAAVISAAMVLVAAVGAVNMSFGYAPTVASVVAVGAPVGAERGAP